MLELDVEALLLGNTGHVHQTRAVGTGHVFGTGLNMAFHLVATHLCGYGGLLHREHATETTALVGALRFYHLYAVD